jgi:hypothetical protein
MSTTCDTMMCGQPATHRISGRAYCERCALSLAESLRTRTGRQILRLPKLSIAAR